MSKRKGRPPKRLTYFSWGLQQLLSSYSKGINKRYKRTGSIFQQNTRAKRTSSEYFMDDYTVWCFIYIHNNPQIAGLVKSPEEYEYASYKDYVDLRPDSICNISLGKSLLSLDINDLFEFKSVTVPPHVMKELFK